MTFFPPGPGRTFPVHHFWELIITRTALECPFGDQAIELPERTETFQFFYSRTFFFYTLRNTLAGGRGGRHAKTLFFISLPSVSPDDEVALYVDEQKYNVELNQARKRDGIISAVVVGEQKIIR